MPKPKVVTRRSPWRGGKLAERLRLPQRVLADRLAVPADHAGARGGACLDLLRQRGEPACRASLYRQMIVTPMGRNAASAPHSARRPPSGTTAWSCHRDRPGALAGHHLGGYPSNRRGWTSGCSPRHCESLPAKAAAQRRSPRQAGRVRPRPHNLVECGRWPQRASDSPGHLRTAFDRVKPPATPPPPRRARLPEAGLTLLR